MSEGNDFIQTMVHDLKTPISAQICACKVLSKNLENGLDREKKEIVDELLASNKFMLNMVQNILTKFKYETNAVDIIKSKGNFTNSVDWTINSLKYLINSKNLTVNFRAKREIIANYDEIEIIRVLNNLFSNAIDFAPEKTSINAWLFQKGNYIFFKISNYANNVSKEEFKNIFTKYSTSGKKYGKIGYGLGLFVSKQIIEAHGGKIIANISTSNNKEYPNIVTFKFVLPI